MPTDQAARPSELVDYATRPPRLPAPEDEGNDGLDIALDTRMGMYRMLHLLRQFEKRAHDLFLQNLVKGTSHLSLGMEAVAAGFAAAMRPDDYTFATYRGHAHTLARGTPPGPVMAELLGRGAGLLGGKGGSMHLTSVEHGMMGSYAIIGAHLCIANGAAWSAQIRGSGQVAVAFFGDGTTNIGAFHEALNFAAVWKLPTVFVCENNLYMEYTPIDLVTAVPHPAADRAAVVRARADPGGRERRRRRPRRGPKGPGDGPGGCRTGADRGGDLPPRRPQPGGPGQVPPSAEVEAWSGARSDPALPPPIAPLGVPEDRLTEVEQQVADEVDAATEFAKASPEPDGRCRVHRRVGRRGERMAQLSYREAVAYGIAQEMRRNPTW